MATLALSAPSFPVIFEASGVSVSPASHSPCLTLLLSPPSQSRPPGLPLSHEGTRARGERKARTHARHTWCHYVDAYSRSRVGGRCRGTLIQHTSMPARQPHVSTCARQGGADDLACAARGSKVTRPDVTRAQDQRATRIRRGKRMHRLIGQAPLRQPWPRRWPRGWAGRWTPPPTSKRLPSPCVPPS